MHAPGDAGPASTTVPPHEPGPKVKNEFSATGSDGRFYTVVRIPSSTTRGPLDGEVSRSGTYSWYLADGTRLNPVDDDECTFTTASGHLTITVEYGDCN